MTSSSFKKQVSQHRMGNFKTKQKTNKTGRELRNPAASLHRPVPAPSSSLLICKFFYVRYFWKFHSNSTDKKLISTSSVSTASGGFRTLIPTFRQCSNHPKHPAAPILSIFLRLILSKWSCCMRIVITFEFIKTCQAEWDNSPVTTRRPAVALRRVSPVNRCFVRHR